MHTFMNVLQSKRKDCGQNTSFGGRVYVYLAIYRVLCGQNVVLLESHFQSSVLFDGSLIFDVVV